MMKFVLAVIAATILICQSAFAGPGEIDIQTTTHFAPPMSFGIAADGMIFEGDPYIECEVIEVRIYWDVVVADGHNAADIMANVQLPIITNAGSSNIDLSGSTLGWSGSGTFNHFEQTDRFNGFFGKAGDNYSSVSWGLDYDAVNILPSSRIEIDYVVPEPSMISLLAAGAIGLLRRQH